MKEWLRRLLQPGPTLKDDPFTWHDKRPIAEQFRSGLRIVLDLLLGFAVVAIIWGGFAYLTGDSSERSNGKMIVVSMGLAAAAAVMLLTAHRWAPLTGGLSFARLLLFLPFQPDSFYKSLGVPQTVFWIAFLPYCAAVIVFTWRFLARNPAPTTFIDRLALTFFVFMTLKQLSRADVARPWFSLAGVLALFIAWCVYRSTPRNPRAHVQSS